MSRELLVGAGVSTSAIGRRVASGWLRPVHRGVYVLDDFFPTAGPFGRHAHATLCHAALLAIPQGVLARQTAAILHRLPVAPTDGASGSVHVVAPMGCGGSSEHFVVHHSRWLPEHHTTVVDGFRTTTAARTLCDLAAVVTERRLRHLVESYLQASAATDAALPVADVLVACHLELARRGRAGTVRMREILEDTVDGSPFPTSRLEWEVEHRLARAGVALDRQFRPPWFDGVRGVVDFADPVGRTIIEADGRSFHSTTQAFDEDRRRDRRAAEHGWVVLRIGWRDVVSDTAAMSDLIAVVRSRRQAAA